MTCGEFHDEDVETIVYRPRSYIECSREAEFNVNEIIPNFDNGKDFKGSKSMPPKSAKRGGFNDIKHNVLNIVSTPMGRRRSKTIVQRCENVGERLKHAMRRTSSLDTLDVENKTKYEREEEHKNHRKSMEDNLMGGFSALAKKTSVSPKSKATIVTNTASVSQNSKVKTGNFIYDAKRVLTFLGKDRSHSFPQYPTENRNDTKKKRRMIKSSSCDDTQELKRVSMENMVNNRDSLKQCPAIKVEFCDEQRSLGNSGHWSSLSNSTGSLSSTHTSDSYEFISSGNSSVFASQSSLHKRTVSSGDEMLTSSRRQHSPKESSNQKQHHPKSLVDIFKQENHVSQFFKSFDHKNSHSNNHYQQNISTSLPKLSTSTSLPKSSTSTSLPKSSTSTSLSKLTSVEVNNSGTGNVQPNASNSTARNVESDVPRKLRSSTFSQSQRNNKSTPELSYDNNNHKNKIILDGSRLRAKSMNDCPRDKKDNKRREHNNNVADIDVTSDVYSKVNNKHSSHSLHFITTPKTWKKLFKKRRSVYSSEIPDSPRHGKETDTHQNEAHTRKCIHIESIV